MLKKIFKKKSVKNSTNNCHKEIFYVIKTKTTTNYSKICGLKLFITNKLQHLLTMEEILPCQTYLVMVSFKPT